MPPINPNPAEKESPGLTALAELAADTGQIAGAGVAVLKLMADHQALEKGRGFKMG
jgi:hypothetical protein